MNLKDIDGAYLFYGKHDPYQTEPIYVASSNELAAVSGRSKHNMVRFVKQLEKDGNYFDKSDGFNVLPNECLVTIDGCRLLAERFHHGTQGRLLKETIESGIEIFDEQSLVPYKPFGLDRLPAPTPDDISKDVLSKKDTSIYSFSEKTFDPAYSFFLVNGRLHSSSLHLSKLSGKVHKNIVGQINHTWTSNLEIRKHVIPKYYNAHGSVFPCWFIAMSGIEFLCEQSRGELTRKLLNESRKRFVECFERLQNQDVVLSDDDGFDYRHAASEIARYVPLDDMECLDTKLSSESDENQTGSSFEEEIQPKEVLSEKGKNSDQSREYFPIFDRDKRQQLLKCLPYRMRKMTYELVMDGNCVYFAVNSDEQKLGYYDEKSDRWVYMDNSNDKFYPKDEVPFNQDENENEPIIISADIEYFPDWQADELEQLMSIEFINSKPMTTSRAIAKVFGREHKTILRSIENILEALTPTEIGTNLCLSNYTDSQNRQQPEFLLTLQGFNLVVGGFSGQKALRYRFRYAQRFEELASQVSSPKGEITENIGDTSLLGRLDALETAFRVESELRKNQLEDISRRFITQIQQTPPAAKLLTGSTEDFPDVHQVMEDDIPAYEYLGLAREICKGFLHKNNLFAVLEDDGYEHDEVFRLAYKFLYEKIELHAHIKPYSTAKARNAKGLKNEKGRDFTGFDILREMDDETSEHFRIGLNACRLFQRWAYKEFHNQSPKNFIDWVKTTRLPNRILEERIQSGAEKFKAEMVKSGVPVL